MADPPAVAQGRIFISYRRDDSAYPAGWLYDRLAERFGPQQIFKDVDSIELGEDFVQEIGEAVGQADVLLALIGQRWLNAPDEHGGRRLDDPDDFVRIEIEAALERKVRVIPILVEGAGMPREDQLPVGLRPLARRQALELSPARFSSDTARLLGVLERALAEARAAGRPAHTPEAPPPPPRRTGWRERLPIRGRVLVGILAAAVLVALVIGGVLAFSRSDDLPPDPPAQADSSPADPVNGSIAFVSDRSGGDEIWSMQPDGSRATQLTFGLADVRRGAWSPDGTEVAFASDRGNDDGNFDLWILTTGDGRTKRLVGGPTDDRAPDWSPDGSEIAFGRAEPGEEDKDVWVIEVASGELRRLTDDPADDDGPDWSTTNRIAFESDRDGDYELYTLDPAGLENDVRQVTSNTWDDLFPDWSPDGLHLAYRSSPSGEPSAAEIYTIGVPAGGPQRLTNNGEDDRRPSWSPDGKLIAFDSESNGQTDIFVVPWNGGEPEPLLTGPGNQEAAAWGTAR